MTTRAKLACWLLVGLATVWGCSSDDDGGSGNNGGPTGSISGVVQGGAKDYLNSATVSVGDLSTTTNESGYFSLSSVPVGTAVLNISRDGYLSIQRVVTVIEGQVVHLANIYLPLAETVTIASATGGAAQTTDGDGVVEFGANAFQNPGGGAYTGDVAVEVTAVMPEDPNFYDAFPGQFEGVRTDGTTVQFISYGFMGVNLYTPDKSTQLQLADGQTATLSLRVTAAYAKRAPETIPMWYLDTATGVWREEGEATLVNNRYEAEVSHFTVWNWDVPVEDICQIVGVVHNEQGQPVQNARVFSRAVESAISDVAPTNASGEFTVRALKSAYSDFWAIKGSYASDAIRFFVGQTCPDTLPSALVLTEPAFSITLTWGQTPDDLDSHLLIPMTWDPTYNYYHVYWANMGSLSSDPYTTLDTDDVSSFGPEVISSAHFYTGTYQYWVHDYTSDDSQVLHDSGAQVQLEIGGGIYLYRAADVSLQGANMDGWWHVADFTLSTTGAVSVQRVMQFQPMFSLTGVYSGKSLGRSK
jgi:hypothetical protein